MVDVETEFEPATAKGIAISATSPQTVTMNGRRVTVADLLQDGLVERMRMLSSFDHALMSAIRRESAAMAPSSSRIGQCTSHYH